MTKKIILPLLVIVLIQIVYGFKYIFGTEMVWLGIYVISFEVTFLVASFVTSLNTSSQNSTQPQ